ncbi:hypothetical protein BGX21_007593 [Mortierella sp. AD011]|nr:hypothetical protein BGX21_007593 [Mortierella sp. AD011]
MPATPSKTKVATAAISAAATSVEGKTTETVTGTTATVVTTVDETVATLEVTNESTVLEVSEVNVTTSVTVTARELPIFKNPLIVDAAISALGPLSIKPKVGRVKATGASKGAVVSVLKLTAPKTEGEVVVMRRMDSDLVNATSMFNASFPSISEEMMEKEMDYLKAKYKTQGAVEEKASSGALAGVWVTISQAKELAGEYGISQFIQPLLEAPSRKSTIKAAAAAAAAAASTTSAAPVATEVSAEETAQKQEQAQEPEEGGPQSRLETIVATVDEVSTKETVEVSAEVKETEETNEDKEVKEEEQEDQASTGETVLKRRIEELEEEVAGDRKRYRGLLTAAAVGLVAVAALPQVIPYFS